MTPVLTPLAPATLTGRPCSNCGGPTRGETAEDTAHLSAIYSCPTCGQQEALTWRAVRRYVLEDISIVEEPHVIVRDS